MNEKELKVRKDLIEFARKNNQQMSEERFLELKEIFTAKARKNGYTEDMIKEIISTAEKDFQDGMPDWFIEPSLKVLCKYRFD